MDQALFPRETNLPSHRMVNRQADAQIGSLLMDDLQGTFGAALSTLETLSVLCCLIEVSQFQCWARKRESS